MVNFSRIEEVAYSRGYRIDVDGFLVYGGECKNNLPDTKGYRCFSLAINGKTKRCFFHRLQAFQKYGELIYQKGIVVRHLNGNSMDNSYDNIAIGTYKDNQRDRPREDVLKYIERMRDAQRLKTGSNYPGGNGRVILEEDKEKIRADHAAGIGYKQLKKKYGYSIGGIFYVCNGRKVKNQKTPCSDGD